MDLSPRGSPSLHPQLYTCAVERCRAGRRGAMVSKREGPSATIIAAVIGAVGTIVAALIALVAVWLPQRSESLPPLHRTPGNGGAATRLSALRRRT